MQRDEPGRSFLTKISGHLVSFPFDLKILQEAVAEPDLDRGIRELAAGVLLNALSPQEGSGPERYLDDAIWLRLALAQMAAAAQAGNEGAAAFCARFEDVFGTLDSDLKLYETFIGPELWGWLCARLPTLVRCTLKGKRAGQFVDDEAARDELYDNGLDFQTNYDVTDEKVHNRLRRPEQIAELLHKRHLEDSKKRG
jgi:hypothetical protein